MENTASNSTSAVARGLLPKNGSSTVAYLRSCCLAMAVVSFVSRSLPSNGSVCHNTQLIRDLIGSRYIYKIESM
jgi:hypothetical protein